jgi:hypothetical protein
MRRSPQGTTKDARPEALPAQVEDDARQAEEGKQGRGSRKTTKSSTG